MANETDSNVKVGIQFTNEELRSGMQDSVGVVRDGAQQMAEQFESVKDALTNVTEAIGIGFAVDKIKEASDAIAEMAHQGLELSEQISNLQQTLGLSAETIQTVGYAAQLVGGNLDTATAALTRLERSAAMADSGNAKLMADFNAIGISASDLAALMKNPDDMIRVVTQHLAEFADGATKTAVEMALMGRGAGAMAPLINELGENWKGLNEEALKFAGVTETDIMAMADTQREINKTNAEFDGLKLQLATALLPAINNVNQGLQALGQDQSTKNAIKGIGDMAEYATTHWKELLQAVLSGNLSSFIVQDFLKSTQAGLDFTNAVKTWWAEITRDAQTTWAGVVRFIEEALQSVAVFDMKAQAVSAFMTGQVQLSKDLNAAADEIAKSDAAQQHYTASVAAATQQFWTYESTLSTSLETHKETVTVMDDVTVHAGKLGDQLLKLPDASNAAEKAAAALREELSKFTEQLDLLEAKASDPWTAANLQFLATMQHLDDEIIKMMGNGLTLAQAMDLYAKASDGATAAFDKQYAKAFETADVLDKLYQKYKDQAAAVGQLNFAAQATIEVDKDINAELAKLVDQYGATNPYVQQMTEYLLANRDATIADITAFKQHEQEMKNSEAAAKEWQSLVQNAFDAGFQAINKDIVEGGNVMKDLANVAKNVVEQILMYFEKLAIINPLLNQIFGLNGTSAQLPTASFGSIINNIAGMFGGGGGFGGGMSGGMMGGSGGGFSIQNLWGAGNQLTGGGLNNFVGGLFGGGGSAFDATSGFGVIPSADELGIVPDYTAMADAGTEFAGNAGDSLGTYGGEFGSNAGSSFMSTVGPMLGGFMAGYQMLGGGTAGIAGGIGLAAAAYFVPIVGWIAGIATLVNSLTGGGLFGTSWKPTGGSETDISLGPGGGSVQDYIEESKKKALFGGTKTKEKSVDASQQQIDAVTQAFDQITTDLTNFATDVGGVVDMVSGNFKTVTDKHGNKTYTETVGGVSYNDQDPQKFAERVEAESFIKSMDDMGIAASKFAAGAQGDADKLMKLVQDMVGTTEAAQADINKGLGLLGTSDTSISDVMNEVIKLNLGNESLSQTYQRLQAETQGTQHWLELLQENIKKTGTSFVEFADDAAKAAGGIDKLNALWQAYFQDYYSASDQSAMQIKVLQKQATSDLTALGLSATTSMADFKKAFESALNDPNLSGDKLAQWLQAAKDLADFTSAVNQSAAAVLKAKDNYHQFEAQFQNVSFVDSYEQGLEQIRVQMYQNIAQANALAQAAGYSGASQQDLADIEQKAGEQMQALTLQLQNAAQQLAFSLGLTNIGSLDQINQEISQLQAQEKSASSAVNNFGNAMGAAAQKATDAMNLLLGNLSPLNDQQKLQLALQGLREGTVTADQVLQIGRNLYASSEAYTQLFNEVLPYAGAGKTPPGQHGGTGSGSSTWTSSDADKLALLLKEQKQMEDAQKLAQFQTLVQEIAEISSAKKEDWQQVAKDMGINLQDLEKGLGLKNDTDLNTMIQTYQKQTDSAGQNTTSIVDAINQLPAELAKLLGIVLQPTANSAALTPILSATGTQFHPVAPPQYLPPPPAAAPPTGGTGSTNVGGNSGGGDLPGKIGAAVGASVKAAFAEVVSKFPRSGRVAMS